MYIALYYLYISLWIRLCYTQTDGLIPVCDEVSNGSEQCIPTNNNLNNCVGSCYSLPAYCYSCEDVNDNCNYGENFLRTCNTLKNVNGCDHETSVQLEFQCRYCYLTIPDVEHKCVADNTSCNVVSNPPQRVKAQCTVNDDVYCLGKRTFTKLVRCNYTTGYKWLVALCLSVTLGGFGIDRFYLGYWKEGLGKLFSFGGLGVWTLIDIALIATGSLGPADGSLFVYPR